MLQFDHLLPARPSILPVLPSPASTRNNDEQFALHASEMPFEQRLAAEADRLRELFFKRESEFQREVRILAAEKMGNARYGALLLAREENINKVERLLGRVQPLKYFNEIAEASEPVYELLEATGERPISDPNVIKNFVSVLSQQSGLELSELEVPGGMLTRDVARDLVVRAEVKIFETSIRPLMFFFDREAYRNVSPTFQEYQANCKGIQREERILSRYIAENEIHWFNGNRFPAMKEIHDRYMKAKEELKAEHDSRVELLKQRIREN